MPNLVHLLEANGEGGWFDAAHELGHLVLHSEHRIPGGREGEPEANASASAFLMPRAGIIEAYRLRALAQLGYRSGDPGSLLARESSQLLAKVFEALRGKGMTAAEPISVPGEGKNSAAPRPELRLVHEAAPAGRAQAGASVTAPCVSTAVTMPTKTPFENQTTTPQLLPYPCDGPRDLAR